MSISAALLANRTVLRLTGSESVSFLQGLVTHDVELASIDRSIYAGLLTPQGKFLFDMFITCNADGDLLLDIEAALKGELIRRLTLYKLRADVSIIDESTALAVWALWGRGESQLQGTPDPRCEKQGNRFILEAGASPTATIVDFSKYDLMRIQNGLPDGSRDILRDKYFWLETNAEALNGISFNKGCYVGQEQNSRMKHRTTIKKCLLPIEIQGATPIEGMQITTSEGKKAGVIHSTSGAIAIAYLRLEYIEGKLQAGGHTVTPIIVSK